MKALVFAVVLFMTAVSASAQVCNCANQVKNDSVATVVDTTVSVAPVVETPEAASTGQTIFVEPVEKYESVVLIVKNAGFNDETCTFVYGGKYYVGKTLAYELAKCYKVGYKVVSTVADPTLGVVHYILERRIK